MRWQDVRVQHPNEWLVIEALEAHTEDHHRVLDRVEVVERCSDGAAALRRYRELHRSTPERELYFLHSATEQPDIVERSWVGVRRNDEAHAPR